MIIQIITLKWHCPLAEILVHFEQIDLRVTWYVPLTLFPGRDHWILVFQASNHWFSSPLQYEFPLTSSFHPTRIPLWKVIFLCNPYHLDCHSLTTVYNIAWNRHKFYYYTWYKESLQGFFKDWFLIFFVSLRYEWKNRHAHSPPYENVHVVFSFIPQGNETNQLVNSYNLISYHFHTKSTGK